MLTRFFKNSNTLSVILITLAAIAVFVFSNFYLSTFTGIRGNNTITALLCFTASIFLLNKICLRNNPKIEGNLVGFTLVLICLSIPVVLTEGKIIIAVFFILLAMRRMLSIQNQLQVSRKIFDSYIFLSIAVFLFPPTLFFLPFPILCVLYYTPLDFRYFLIPIPAILSVWMSILLYHLALKNHFPSLLDLFHFNLFPSIEKNEISALAGPLLFVLLFLGYSLWAQLSPDTRETVSEKKWKSVQFSLGIMAVFTVYFSGPYTSSFSTAIYFIFISVVPTIGGYFARLKQSSVKEILFLIFLIGCLFFSLNPIFHFTF